MTPGSKAFGALGGARWASFGSLKARPARALAPVAVIVFAFGAR